LNRFEQFSADYVQVDMSFQFPTRFSVEVGKIFTLLATFCEFLSPLKLKRYLELK